VNNGLAALRQEEVYCPQACKHLTMKSKFFAADESPDYVIIFTIHGRKSVIMAGYDER